MLKNLAYAFIYTSSTGLSVITRIAIPTILLLYLLISSFLKLKPLSNLFYMLPALVAILIILHTSGSFRKILGGLQFVVIFIAIGLAINLLAKFFNFWVVDITSAAIASLKGALMFMTIASIFQWTRIEEIRWFLEKIGLGELGTSIAIAFSQIPYIMIVYSEALSTVKLKYGSRYLYKALLPMILHSVNYAKEITEATYIYGIPKYPIDASIKIVDAIIVVASSMMLLLCLYLSITINAFL